MHAVSKYAIPHQRNNRETTLQYPIGNIFNTLQQSDVQNTSGKG
jgi:hypothetical protein